jgi:hypothetical protein
MSGHKLLILGKEESEKISNFDVETYSNKVDYSNLDSPQSAEGPLSPDSRGETSACEVEEESFGVEDGVDGVEDEASLTQTVDSESMYIEEIPKEAPPPPVMLVPFSEQVKPVMKLLKRACKRPGEEELVLEAVEAVRKLANTTFQVRTKLGE